MASGLLPPAPIRDLVVGNDGTISVNWKNWFTQLYNKIGGEGSSNFTPTLSTDGTPGTVTYSVQSGRYSTIGTLRLVEFDIEISNWTGSPTGDVIVGGLPTNFASSGASGSISKYSKITLGASHTQLGINGALNQSYAYLYSFGSGSGVSAAKVPIANIATTAKITGAITYSV